MKGSCFGALVYGAVVATGAVSFSRIWAKAPCRVCLICWLRPSSWALLMVSTRVLPWGSTSAICQGGAEEPSMVAVTRPSEPWSCQVRVPLKEVAELVRSPLSRRIFRLSDWAAGAFSPGG